MTAVQTYDRGFLEARSRILDLAAWLDRIDRGSDSVTAHPGPVKLRAALAILLDGQPDRAERVQTLFSRPYDPQWAEGFAPMASRGHGT